MNNVIICVMKNAPKNKINDFNNEESTKYNYSLYHCLD
jgi:hypothetical protein